MSRVIASLALLFALAAGPRAAADKPVDQTLASRTMQSVALLYSQSDSGGMQMRCTATAFEKIKGGYLFASAAHCVGDDRDEKVARFENIAFYVTFDGRGQKVFYQADVDSVGYQHHGDDFSVFAVQTDQTWPVTPLGDESKIDVGKPETATIINVASPLGLGKQLFTGTITNVYLDRPVVEGDINWRGTMLLQISAGPGSSGSAIISEQQQAIVGFLVGTVGTSNVIAMPVSRFKDFRRQWKAGTYKYMEHEAKQP